MLFKLFWSLATLTEIVFKPSNWGLKGGKLTNCPDPALSDEMSWVPVKIFAPPTFRLTLMFVLFTVLMFFT